MRFFDRPANGSTNSTPVIEENDTSFRILQTIWDLRLGREPWFASPVFPVVLSVSVYAIVCSIYMLIDLYDRKWVHRFKIQSDKVVTWPMMFQAIRFTLLNNVLLILPSVIAQWIWVPDTPLPKLAPSFIEFSSQLWAMLILFDFQYWVWHAIHHKSRWLYRTFHSVHHQYHSTFSWTTQYLHPWELFTVGFFATVDGWFFECHPLTYWGFMLTNIVVSIEAHSGFDLPIFPHKWFPFGLYGGGPKHDMHHMRPLTNFQPFFSTWDRLMGWECPGIGAGGNKSKQLLQWEQDNRSQTLAKHATQLMSGTINGQLSPDKESASPPIGTENEHSKAE